MELDTVSKNIGLNLPKRSPLEKSSFDISRIHVTTWLNDLPKANIGATAKQIYTVLRTTNTLNYPYKKRMQFLDLLRDDITLTTKAMEKHYVGVNIPLPDKSQKITNITKKLFSYMATGYKIALEDAINNPPLFGKTKFLETLAHRCISYIGKTILTSYQSYSQFPNQLWSDLNKIYLYAEKQNLQNIKISNRQNNIKETSIMDEYSRILLLSLASPSHLQHGESDKVYSALKYWLTLPTIHPFSSTETTSDCFVINLEKSTAPSSLSSALAGAQPDESSLRIINTEEVIKKASNELNKKRANSSNSIIKVNNAELSSNLLQRLLVTWDINTKRHYPRAAISEDIKITLGLSAIHQLMSHKNKTINKQKYNDKFAKQSQFSAADVSHNVNSPMEDTQDIWNINYLPDSDYDFAENALVEDANADADVIDTNITSKEYQPDNWLIINESKMGLSINNRDELNNRIEVGELVSIARKTDTKNNTLNIGIIRWLRFNADESLQVGIEILNKNISAIGVRAGDTPLQCALMLPELAQMKQPAYLLTRPVSWKKGAKITINMRGKEVPVVLTNSVQNSGLFSQFQFKIDEDSPKEVEKSTQKDITPKESDIWSLI